jgi:ribosomal protein L25 (general stress protein Ctc)
MDDFKIRHHSIKEEKKRVLRYNSAIPNVVYGTRQVHFSFGKR